MSNFLRPMTLEQRNQLTSPQQLASQLWSRTKHWHRLNPDFVPSKFNMTLKIIANNKKFGWNNMVYIYIYQTWKCLRFSILSNVYGPISLPGVLWLAPCFLENLLQSIHTSCSHKVLEAPNPIKYHAEKNRHIAINVEIPLWIETTLWVCISLQCRFNWISALVLAGWWKLHRVMLRNEADLYWRYT